MSESQNAGSGAGNDMLLQTSRGAWRLQRYPRRPRETLQAWCAADSLLIEQTLSELADHALGESGSDIVSENGGISADTGPMLVVNDDHGALALALAAQHSWTDSALSALALAANCRLNGVDEPEITYSTQHPPQATRVIMRVPKQLAYFEYQLACLATNLPAGTPILAGGMDKHLSPHTADLIAHYLGPTQRLPGQRKARLFKAVTGQIAAPEPSPWQHYFCQALSAELKALPNVFSRDRLDGGSELLLTQLHKLAPAARITDLACGNGVLGLAALKAGLSASVLFCDESAMAIASARENLYSVCPDKADGCHFLHGDGLKAYSGEAVDLMLCNPPFHLQHTVDDFAGRRLLGQAAQHLKPDGRLCLVANRHLRYRPALERLFGKVDVLAENRRFIVWLAHGPRPAGS